MKWLFLALVLVSCNKKPEVKERPPISVKTAKVETRTIPYTIDTIGNVTALTSVNLIPQVSGYLSGLYFTNGAYVRKGDLLATIDPRPYEATLEQARGQLRQAQAQATYQKSKVERYKQLIGDEFVSQLDYEQYIANLREAEGQVEQASGMVAKAQVELDYCYLKAPMDARAGANIIDPGNIVGPQDQTPIVVLNQVSPIYATFTVPERYFADIVKYNRPDGLDVLVKPLGEENRVFTAKLNFFNNAVDTSSGTIEMKARYANRERDLWPGQFVRIQVILYEIPNALIIPSEAIGIDTDGKYVFIVKEDMTVEKRQVLLGQRQGDEQIVSSGLKPGEVVVTRGKLNLTDGSKVKI